MEDFVTYEQSVKLKELGFNWKCNHFYCQPKGKELRMIEYIPMDFMDSQYHDFNNPETWSDKNVNTPSAPTLTQVAKWLRDVKGIALNIIAHDGGFYQWEDIFLPNAPEFEVYIHPDIIQYSTYEQALSTGIDRTLELLTEQK